MYKQSVHHRSKISTKFCTRQQILTQTSRIPNFIKIRPPVVELLHADGRADRSGQANGFSFATCRYERQKQQIHRNKAKAKTKTESTKQN